MPGVVNDHDRIIRVEEGLAASVEQQRQYALLTERALEVQKESVDDRLERMNEFRAALTDAQASFLTREVYTTAHIDLVNRVDALREEVALLRVRFTGELAAVPTREMLEGVTRELTAKIDANALALQRALPREVFDGAQKEVAARAEALAATVTSKPSQSEHDQVADRVKALEEWRAKAAGFAALLAIISGAVGAAISRAFGS